jgi:hypothetical protein
MPDGVEESVRGILLSETEIRFYAAGRLYDVYELPEGTRIVMEYGREVE